MTAEPTIQSSLTEALSYTPPGLAEALEQLRHLAPNAETVAAALAPGTEVGDALLLLSTRVTEQEREAALTRVAARLPYPSRDPRAVVALRREARANEDSFQPRPGQTRSFRFWREYAAPAAVALALGEAERPQRIRAGRKWAKDEAGRRTVLRPLDLALADWSV